MLQLPPARGGFLFRKIMSWKNKFLVALTSLAFVISAIISGGIFWDAVSVQAMPCVNEPDDHLNPACAKIPGGHHPDAPPKPGEDGKTSRNDPNWEEEKKDIKKRNKEKNVKDASGSYDVYVNAVGQMTSLEPTQNGEGGGNGKQWNKSGVQVSRGRTCTGSVCTIDPGYVGRYYYCPAGPNAENSVCDPKYNYWGTAVFGGQVDSGGSLDCVALANKHCAPVQVDVDTVIGAAQNQTGGHGAVTCYPTKPCGEVKGAQTTYTPPPSESHPTPTPPGNGGHPTPTPTPHPTPTPTPTPTPFPTPTPTPTPSPTPSPTPTPTPTPPTKFKVCKFEDDDGDGNIDDGEDKLTWTFFWWIDGGDRHEVTANWWNVLTSGCAIVDIPTDRDIRVEEEVKSGWRPTGLYVDGVRLGTGTDYTFRSHVDEVKVIWFLNTFTPTPFPTPTPTPAPTPTPTPVPGQPTPTPTPAVMGAVAPVAPKTGAPLWLMGMGLAGLGTAGFRMRRAASKFWP